MRQTLSYLLWPLLFVMCLIGTQVGIASSHPVAGFNLTYATLAIVLAWLERVFPHQEKWNNHDGQIKADLFHTILNKGMVQVFVVVSTIIGVAEKAGSSGLQIWPSYWPMWAQVILSVIVMDFGLYWKHRIAHEWAWLWPFHAVHHSAPRLWFFNTGRFHVVDTVTGVLFGLPLLFLLGAPNEVFSWAAGITAYIGMLTHCNVEMRFGFLSAIFNTPELHRWHHSRRLREGNKNYGENLMLWDHVFRSYFRENRPSPKNIGIYGDMPENFIGQLKAPFVGYLGKVRSINEYYRSIKPQR